MSIKHTYFKIASHGRVLLCASAFLVSSLQALPTGGVVTSGSADITSSKSVTNVNQQSQKASIDWQGFSISPDEIVNFNQPNQNSLILNKVIGDERSIIEGSLNANGRVFIINSNGILFTKGSSVNTAGLIASALKLSNEDFDAGHFVFKADPNSKGSVINLGTIQAKDKGYVSLLGESVINEGVIIANKGTVSLNSGDKITLNFNGNSLVDVSIDEGTLNSLVKSSNAIIADGGIIILTAKGADELMSSQVNIKGIVRAQSIDDLRGSVNINAINGESVIDGSIDVSAIKGEGGFVETSGSKVTITDNAVINAKSKEGKTGTWFIDPKDFTVGVDITGQKLSENLETANVVIESQTGKSEGKGDINVNERVEWSADTTLTLTAQNDININDAISSHGESAGVILNYGGEYHILTPASFSGAVLDEKGIPTAKKDTSNGQYASISFYGNNAKLTINGQEYVLIYSLDQLDALDGYDALTNEGASVDVNGYYALAHYLDGEGRVYLNSLIGLSDTAWSTGYVGTRFGGVFAGLGHKIDKLTIASDKLYTALFAGTGAGGTIRDLGLTNVDVSTSGVAGSLVGANSADISGVYAMGKVHAAYGVGGLAGLNDGVSVFSNVFADIEASSGAGGLIGEARGSSITIKNSHTTGSVTGSGSGGLIAYTGSATTIEHSYSSVDILNGGGGLIGQNYAPLEITNSFATGDITGGGGGIIGNAHTANTLIKNVYATGDVRGGGGGFIGSFGSSLQGAGGTVIIQDSFATGDVYGEGSLGGFIGILNYGAAYVVDNVYATGNVISTAGAGNYGTYVGGLIGGTYGGVTITNSHATGNVEGGVRTGGLVGFGMGTISDSWASGNVNGMGESAGGLVGSFEGSSIINSYATGNVKGGAGTFTGGLVGSASSSGTVISNVYATGAITGGVVGGIIGRVSSGTTITNGYFNQDENPDITLAGEGDGVINGGGALSGEEAAFADLIMANGGNTDFVRHFITGRGTASVASTALQRDNTNKNSIQIDRSDVYAYGTSIDTSIMNNVTMSNLYSSDIGGIDIGGESYIISEEE
jgi:filamentous hemagglutinin family protein